MNCNIFTNNILPYLDHELEEEQFKQFDIHLTKCQECARIFQQVKLSYAIIDFEKEFTVSNSFMESMKRSINRGENRKVYQLIAEVLKPLAVAASIGLGVMIGNGELSLLNSNDILTVEVSDAFIPAAPTDYSIWATVNLENGN